MHSFLFPKNLYLQSDFYWSIWPLWGITLACFLWGSTSSLLKCVCVCVCVYVCMCVSIFVRKIIIFFFGIIGNFFIKIWGKNVLKNVCKKSFLFCFVILYLLTINKKSRKIAIFLYLVVFLDLQIMPIWWGKNPENIFKNVFPKNVFFFFFEKTFGIFLLNVFENIFRTLFSMKLKQNLDQQFFQKLFPEKLFPTFFSIFLDLKTMPIWWGKSVRKNVSTIFAEKKFLKIVSNFFFKTKNPSFFGKHFFRKKIFLKNKFRTLFSIKLAQNLDRQNVFFFVFKKKH